MRRKRLRRLAHDDVGAMSVHLQLDAERGDGHQDVAVDDDVGEHRHRPRDSIRLRLLRGLETCRERRGVLLECLAAFDDLHPLANVANALDVDAQAEAVEQLGTKLAFLRVHRADEDETRRMRHRHALALDGVLTHRRGVEEHVDDVVVEQVHLVDVEDVAVRVGEHARLELLLAALDRGLDVDGADDAVLGRVDGQLDNAHPASRTRQRLATHHALGALRALQIRLIGRAPVAAVGHDIKTWQQLRERAHRSRFRGALLTANQHTADRGIDRVENERLFHEVLSHDRGEREHASACLHHVHCVMRPRSVFSTPSTMAPWERS